MLSALSSSLIQCVEKDSLLKNKFWFYWNYPSLIVAIHRNIETLCSTISPPVSHSFFVFLKGLDSLHHVVM